MHNSPLIAVTITLQLLLYLILHSITAVSIDEAVKCNFDDGTFCEWQYLPSTWTIGYKPPVFGQYAYIEGINGAYLEARLLSPVLNRLNAGNNNIRVEFLAWKSAATISIDLCQLNTEELLCLKTVLINDLGTWTRHSTILASLRNNSQILFRVRNLTNGQDVFGIDDIIIKRCNDSINAVVPNTVIFPKYRPQIKNITGSVEGNEQSTTDTISDRRFQSTQSNLSYCAAVKCTVTEATCQLNLSKHWRRSEGRLLVSTAGIHQITTPTFIAPMDSFLEFNLWMSDDTKLTILESSNDDSDKNRELWNRNEQTNEKGWHAVRIPVRTDGLPEKLTFIANVPAKNFLALSDIKLTNIYGQEISCGNDTVLHLIHEKAASVVTPLKSPTPTTNYIRNQSPIRPQIIRGSHNYQFIINNSSDSSGGIPRNSRNPYLSNNLYPGDSTSTASTTQLVSNGRIGSTFGGSSVQLLKSRNVAGDKMLRNPIVLSRLRADNSSLTKSSYLTARQLQNNQVPPVPLNASVSFATAQPVVLEQIRDVARQLGFPNLTGQQALELIKALLSSKTREKLFGRNKLENGALIGGLQPIKPINAPPETDLKLNSDSMGLQSLFPSHFQAFHFLKRQNMLPQNLNIDFLRRIASVLTPPNIQTDSQRPLTRQNLDFVIQNANSV
uniref:MAM domain-containing protein n=1 Tax=Syphacia muris TaxID=451379 RepID=A0A0N5AIC2_9BILA